MKKLSIVTLITLISSNLIYNLYGMDAQSSAPATRVLTRLEQEAAEPTSLISILPRDIVREIEPYTPEAEVQRIITQAQNLEQAFQSLESSDVLYTTDSKYIGQLLHQKFAKEINPEKNFLGGVYPPLSQAVRDNNINRVKLLIAAGADLNREETDKFRTPLMQALSMSHDDVIELLIAAGANVNKGSSQYGYQPLHAAAVWGKEKIVQRLIDAGANLNDNNNSEKVTPLHQAAIHGYKNTVKRLLAAGADPNKENYQGKTPLNLAISAAEESSGDPYLVKDFQETIALLKSHGAK